MNEYTLVAISKYRDMSGDMLRQLKGKSDGMVTIGKTKTLNYHLFRNLHLKERRLQESGKGYQYYTSNNGSKDVMAYVITDDDLIKQNIFRIRKLNNKGIKGN